MATPIYPYTPFVYLIGWSKLNMWYIGCRYAELDNAHPSQLWTSYYTSSKHVKRFAKKKGDPDVIMVLKTFTDPISTLNYEHKVLRRLNVKGRKDFLNKNNGFGDSHGDATGTKWIRNHSDPKKATEERYIDSNDPVPDGWCYGRKSGSKEMRKKLSMAGKGRKFSPEHIAKRAATRKGKRRIRNHPDINQATKSTYIDPNEPMPEGWCYGGLPHSKEYKERMSGKNNPWYGKGMSEEEKIKLSKLRKGKKYIRNHIDPKLATETKMISVKDPVPEGWYYSVPHSPETRSKMSEMKKGKKRIRNHIDPNKATKVRLIDPNEPVPEGWCYGSIPPSPEARKKISETLKSKKQSII